MKQQAALACQEVRHGFQRTPVFPHLYKDFYELYTLADHVHHVIRSRGDLCRLTNDVAQMDALLHHIQDLTAPIGISQAGRTGRGYQTLPACDNVSNPHHRRLQILLAQMEDNIHHLQEELEAASAPPVVVPPWPPHQVDPGFPLSPGHRGIAPQPSRYLNPGLPLGRGLGTQDRNRRVAFTIRIGG